MMNKNQIYQFEYPFVIVVLKHIPLDLNECYNWIQTKQYKQYRDSNYEMYSDSNTVEEVEVHGMELADCMCKDKVLRGGFDV